MARICPIPAVRGDTTLAELPRAEEIASITSALPFFPDPDQERALAYMRSGHSSPEVAETIRDAISRSLEAMTTRSEPRALRRIEKDRASQNNIDHAFLASGLVKRLTARIPPGPNPGHQRRIEQTSDTAARAASLKRNDTKQRHFPTIQSRIAYFHALARAHDTPGKGLRDAARAMIVDNLLSEAECLYGVAPKHHERLFIRDAVFAADNQRIEDIARILRDAPIDLQEERGECCFPDSGEDYITTETPLIFVQCMGLVESDLGDHEIVLEAVDFQSLDILDHCLKMIDEKCEKITHIAHDAIIERSKALNENQRSSTTK